MAMIAKLVPSYVERQMSFQAINVTAKDRATLISMFIHPSVAPAQPFLEGDSDGWIMVQFLTRDHQILRDAAQALAKSVGVSALVKGQFTRKELGLE